MPEDAQAKPSLALTSPLRLALIGAFVPAFPLCIAHGAASGSPTPAVGIVPLFVSFASAAASLRFRGIVEADAERRDDEDAERRDDEDAEPQTGAANFREKLTHPIAVFLLDTVLAAALMVVLVFTWVFTGRSASLSMLAAYTTIPLLVGL
jgi:hypothetical protein